MMDNKQIPQHNLDQQIHRGKQASIILDEPLLKEAFEYLSESYRSEIFKTMKWVGYGKRFNKGISNTRIYA
jgi:hypothetical protein